MNKILTIGMLFVMLTQLSAAKTSVIRPISADRVVGLSAPTNLAEDIEVIGVDVKKINMSKGTFDLEPITEAPAGEVKCYYGSSMAYGKTWTQEPLVVEKSLTPIELVFTENNEVYWKNPITYIRSLTYLVGYISNDEIIFPMPQYLYDEREYGGPLYYVGMMELTTDDLSSEEYNAILVENENLVLKIDEEGNINQQGSLVLGAFDGDEENYGQWTYYGDSGYSFHPLNVNVVNVPKEASFEKWALHNAFNLTYRFIDVAVCDNKVYMKNFYTEYPDAVICGNIRDDKVVFDQIQYLGMGFMNFMLSVPARLIESVDPDNGTTVYIPEIVDNLELDYDAEGKSLKIQQELDVFMANEGFTDVSWWEIVEPELIVNQGEVTDFTPIAPKNSYFVDKYEEYQAGFFIFQVFNFNEKDQVLDPSNLYYQIFVDGELMEFYSSEYPSIPDGVTAIPFNYFDYYYIVASGSYRQLMIFQVGIDSLGVRMVYFDPITEERYYSDIVTIDLSGQSGVDVINESSNVVMEQLYDLTGCRVGSPIRGSIIIKKIIYSDGTIETVKEIVK